ncbi:MAG TPA: hypothetical protein VFF48_12970 [Brevundimonas sp.]|nr:hypothetical protein [Brevundimonas sp.]
MGQVLKFNPPKPRPTPEADAPEVIATLMIAMENSPLQQADAFPVRDQDGRCWVAVRFDGVTLRLSRDDARMAADALWFENAFIGAIDTAHRLRVAADNADALQILAELDRFAANDRGAA